MRPDCPPPSCAHCPSSRRPSARSTAPAPARRRARERSDRFRPSSCSSFLPDTLGLQGVGDFFRHVILVVLCKNAVGDENAIRTESAFSDDALLFPEKIRKNAAIGNLDRFLLVRH